MCSMVARKAYTSVTPLCVLLNGVSVIAHISLISPLSSLSSVENTAFSVCLFCEEEELPGAEAPAG